MSDHAWSQEHAVAFAAGGLTAEEAERLTAHARDCPECAAAIESARRLDRGLGELFAADRPGPALEDRAIWRFRSGRRRQTPLVAGWVRRVTAAAAVLAIVGTFGGLAGSLITDGRLPLPGVEVANAARIHREGTARVDADTRAKELIGSLLLDTTTLTRFSEHQAPGKDLTNEALDRQSDPRAVAQSFDAFGSQRAAGQGQLGWQTYGWGEGSLRGHQMGSGIGGIGGIGGGGFGGGIGGISGFGGGIAGNPPQPGTVPQDRSHVEGAITSDPVAVPGLTFAPNAPMTWTHRSITPQHNYYQAADPNAAGRTYFVPSTARPALQTPDAPKQGQEGGQPKPATPPGTTAPPAKTDPSAQQKNPEPAARRVVLRSGDIEFEVESFDSALATVTKLVTGINGGFVATVNSEKLPNGKVKGTVTVRVPPEHLDGLVLDLRRELGKGGELKGVRISSQDVTKQYTDLESRLRAARTMEQRLLQIIKEGKGEIKQLLEAEKELGVWRTKIEELEGELRYYSNLAALSTLTITLAEKEIRAAAGLTESERVQAGVEVEDVDKAYQALLAAVVEAKGRVSKSELKQLSAGQFNATLHFEVAPEASGPMRDRLHQFGRVARLEIDRVQQPGSGTVAKDAKVTRGDTVFLVQLYNLVNIAPREVATLQVAVPDVPAAYQSVRDAIAKAAGRVFTAQLNEQDRQNVSAQLDFEVRRVEEGAVRAALDAAGEVVARQVARAPESDAVTDSKVLYRATLLSAARLKPREVTTLALEVENVDQTVKAFAAEAAEVKGRQVDAQSAHESNGRVTAKVVYEVPLSAAAGLVERFKAAGTVRVQQTARDPHAPDGKYATARIDVTVSNPERIVGRDDGVWPQVRRGLSYSASVLLTSVTWVVFGLCVVLPWALVGYGGYRLVRRLSRPAAPSATPPAA